MKLTNNEKIIVEDFLSEVETKDIQNDSIKTFLSESETTKFFTKEKLQYIIRLIKEDESFFNSLKSESKTIVEQIPVDGAKGLDGIDGRDGRDGTDGQEGVRGSDGTSINWQSDWNANKQYIKSDVVKYLKNIYIALTDNQDIVPTNKIVWELLFEKAKDGLKGPVGSGTGVREVKQICEDTFINTNIDKLITANIVVDSAISGQLGNVLSLLVIDENGNVITEE